MSSAPVLRADDLSAGYPGVPVLQGLDLEVRAGQPPTGVIGPSGVGKTTLVHALRGSLKPTSGSVTYNGRAVHRLRGKDKKQFNGEVRAVSQYSMTITDPKITAGGVLKNALREARKAGRTHATPIDELLDAAGLAAHFTDRRMITLSGGERQRVALASALATRPEILLLDEPLTAVDPQARRTMATRLGDMAITLGTGILLLSHDLDLVAQMCPQVHVLAEDGIVASGSLPEVLATSQHSVVRDFAEAAPRANQPFRLSS
ncbi:MAG TPA: ATP-binding cassette domain-containing protein [Beutenbergiaceae bacterium]|nr:ATP-binding cassette domain-containing protein [Beutenbergiaceae bacterium]